MSKVTIEIDLGNEGLADELSRLLERYGIKRRDAWPLAEPAPFFVGGWVCPVCGCGMSPYQSQCSCANPWSYEITCETATSPTAVAASSSGTVAVRPWFDPSERWQ